MKHEKLRARMEERGITQRRLAKEVGIAPSSLCLKLAGELPFSWKEIVKVCDSLGISNPVGWFEA